MKVRVSNTPGQSWRFAGKGECLTRATRKEFGSIVSSPPLKPAPEGVCKYGHEGQMFRNSQDNWVCRQCRQERSHNAYLARKAAA